MPKVKGKLCRGGSTYLMLETIIHKCNVFASNTLYVLIMINMIYEWRKLIKKELKIRICYNFHKESVTVKLGS